MSDSYRQIQDPRRLLILVAAFYHIHGPQCDHYIRHCILCHSYSGIVAIRGLLCSMRATFHHRPTCRRVGRTAQLHYLLDFLGLGGIFKYRTIRSLFRNIAVSAAPNKFVLLVILVVRIGVRDDPLLRSRSDDKASTVKPYQINCASVELYQEA